MEKDMDIVGMELLNETEKEIANKLFKDYYKKIKRKIRETDYLKIHIKEYDKEGDKKKYSIHAKIIGQESIKANAFDWDLAKTIHKLFKKIETEVEHKFHTSEQH